jgi:4-hydroxybenzoate polyprenyltransferase
MAREGGGGRRKAVAGEAPEAAGVVQSGDQTAAPAPPAPSATGEAEPGGWRAREQRAAQRRAARADAGGDPDTGTTTDTDTDTRTETAAATDAADGGPEAGRSPFRLRDLTPFLLVRAAHPRQALLTALGITVAAALAGRPSRELLLILVTMLVGQVVLGWFNDLVDRQRDARHHRSGKPVADGRLDPGTLWFCLALAVFLVVPLSVANGRYAGTAYLLSLAIGLVGQWVPLRRGFLSWLPWAASYALYPAFLSYGGWGGQVEGAPPELLMTGLAALLGIGVHLLTALWGLVPDNADGWTYLPLKLGLRIGASRLLWVAGTYTVLVLVALALVGSHVGLAQEPL